MEFITFCLTLLTTFTLSQCRGLSNGHSGHRCISYLYIQTFKTSVPRLEQYKDTATEMTFATF